MSEFVPERVFIYNLCSICCGGISSLWEEINEEIINDIHKKITKVEEKICKTDTSSTSSILPPKFKHFIENQGPNSRKKQYYLLQCHKLIIYALNHITKEKSHVHNENDCELLKKFKNIIIQCSENDTGITSYRNFQRLINISGNAYNTNNQIDLIKYMVTNVVPKVLLDNKKIENLCDKFKMITSGFDEKELKPKFNNKRNMSYQEVEDSINKIAGKIKSHKRNKTKIGKDLYDVFEILRTQYKNNGLIFELIDDQYQDSYDYSEFQPYFYSLSSQILGFIKLLGIVGEPPYDNELFDVISKAIDYNSNIFFIEYKEIICHKSLSFASNTNNIFVDNPYDSKEYRSKLKDLRRELLKILLNYEYFKVKLVDVYLINLYEKEHEYE